MKKIIGIIVSALLLMVAPGCVNMENEKQDPSKIAQIVATTYDNELVKDVSQTQAGNIDSWKAQVFTPSGGNNDDVTTDSLIKSPWHTLTINDTEVPVYTARCGKGAHSFAWVDVTTVRTILLKRVFNNGSRLFQMRCFAVK